MRKGCAHTPASRISCQGCWLFSLFKLFIATKKLCIHVTTVIDREHTFMPADTILAEAQSILSSVGTCSYTFGTCVDQSRLAGPLPSMREDVRIDLVEGAQPARLFKGLIGAYHYLGYRQANGAQVKYLVAYRDRPVACLSFGPAAFKVAARDQFIGWSAAPELELTWIGKANHPNLEQRILLDDPEKSRHAPHRVGENNIFDNKRTVANFLALDFAPCIIRAVADVLQWVRNSQRVATVGRILKWPTRADCKSAGLRLRRFESFSYHHFLSRGERGGGNLPLNSGWNVFSLHYWTFLVRYWIFNPSHAQARKAEIFH